MRLAPKQLAALEDATATYQANVAVAAGYLKGRGINGETAHAARLGVVTEPHPGHEAYVGRLAIPYLTRAGVVDIRFRCAQAHDCKAEGHPKYLSQAGHKPRLYNTPAIDQAGSRIAITEGELDALILTHRCGIPAVGVPGSQAWTLGVHPRVFADFDEVLIFADADKAGQDLADTITVTLPNARTIALPDGLDPTDLYLQAGPDAIRRLAHLDQP